MKEIQKIITAFDNTDFDKRKAALATVIKVEGSSYRSPGAMMYLTDNGRWVGSISGGCLEGDALRKSKRVIEEGVPQIVIYDTTDGENNTLGINLGCNGIVHILLEPINREAEVMNCLKEIKNRESIMGMATVIAIEGEEVPLKQAQRVLITAQGDTACGRKLVPLMELVQNDLLEAIVCKKSRMKNYVMEGNARAEVFLEVFEPAIDLLVFGGGFDAKPIVSFANQLGWGATVIDECFAQLLPVNFQGTPTVACQREEVLDHVIVKPYSAAILKSHNFKYDLMVLKQLLTTKIRYIGILGPKKRGDKLISELSKYGYTLSKEDFPRIHNPIGLDIGADTPEEIALSIVTEVKSKFSGRSGGFLKYRQGAIHTKDAQSNEVFKQVYLKPNEQYQKGIG